jgi:hypothetical protein
VTHSQQSYALKMASTMSPQMIGSDLANDLLESIAIALEANAVFSEGSKPITIFRDAVAKAITDIEERASLLRRFLRDGPYEHDGDIPPELQGRRLTDEETSRTITFIYSHVVNCFQGRLAELLAAGPCVKLVEELKVTGRVSPSARLYMGDAVLFPGGTAGRYQKAADMHVISPGAPSLREAEVLGVIEVKSYACSKNRLWEQLARHRSRVQKCILMSIMEKGTRWEARVAYPDNIFSVGVTAATWKIPRTFSFIQQEGKRILDIDEPSPPKENPWVKQTVPENWRIILRWSQEVLASAAYEMTFWYMEKLGEVIFSEIMPPEWRKMTTAEAGRNAAKMMLYYAIPRCPSRRAEQRAIALYNTYGFGYALGMNFRDANGRREMLWPEDLDEIARTGSTKHGCSIRH